LLVGVPLALRRQRAGTATPGHEPA
jgi:hypothetical protein